MDAASEDAASAPSDGGEPMLSNSEAGAAGGLPSWALELVGTYAKRSVTFSYDDYVPPPTNTQNVEHAIVKIAQQNDKLRVTMQPCEYTVALKGDSGSPVAFKYPDRFPPLTGDILIGDDDTFVSSPMISHLGFDPVRGGGCTNGRRAPYEDQPWLMDSCQCFAGVLPGMQTDCRVTDTDGDNRSGITMLNPGPITGRYTDVSIVFDYAVTISKGELKSGKRVEWSETRTQSQACINASVDLCSVGNNQLCPGGTTMLIRLSEQVTDAGCEALDKGLFPPAGNSWPEPIDCRMK